MEDTYYIQCDFKSLKNSISFKKKLYLLIFVLRFWRQDFVLISYSKVVYLNALKSIFAWAIYELSVFKV